MTLALTYYSGERTTGMSRTYYSGERDSQRTTGMSRTYLGVVVCDDGGDVVCRWRVVT